MTRRVLTPPLVYALLAVAVAGPLLAPGLVLAVDLALVPHPHLASAYWGVAQGTHEGSLDRLPLDALFVLLGRIGAVAVGEKLLLLAIVFLAGLGMHRAVPARTATGRYFAGLLYAVNPFVYDRLYTGQWFMLLGYALLPWAFRQFSRLLEGDWRRSWRFAAVAFAVGVASSHMILLLGVLCLFATAAVLVAGTAPRLRVAGATGLGTLLAVLPSLYWLLPTPGVRDLWRHIGAAQLELYRTVPDHAVGVVGTVAGLYGYWNDPTPVKAFVASWPLLAACLVALALWGLRHRAADPLAWGVALAGVFGLVLAMGTDGPVTGSAFSCILAHLEPARSFREPQKAVALLVFAYAYLGAAAVDDLRMSVRTLRRRAPALAVTCMVALPLLYGYRELGGLWGAMTTSRYPASWVQANATLRREATGSRTLFLPWHGYLGLAFAADRVVANPAPSYFSTPILASRSVGAGAAAADNSDPTESYVAALLARAPTIHDLGACLAPLGVSHVLVARGADYEGYAAIAKQRDLVLERSWGDLALYRSTVPTSIALTTASSRSGGSCTQVASRLRPLDATLQDPAHIRIAGSLPNDGVVVLASSFRPDWSLAGTKSKPFLSVVNSFPSPGGQATIELGAWGGYRRNYVLGLLGALVFAATRLLVPRPRQRTETHASRAPIAGSKLWVVLPTYNEAENVEPMTRALLAVFDQSALTGTVLVVDDSSPDGTGEIAKRLALEEPAVRVLHRPAKKGLGPAYTDGFAFALEHGAELVVEMDCDFSHDPADLVRLVHAAANADLVLGSRYAQGGRTENWGLVRKTISRGGCWYARTVLGVSVRDLTGGFKCFRRETLLGLDAGSASAAGYGFQIELTYRAVRQGFHVVEVPIVFRERRAGSSKMSWRIVLEAMLLVPRLRLRWADTGSDSSEHIPVAELDGFSDPSRLVAELTPRLLRGEARR